MKKLWLKSPYKSSAKTRTFGKLVCSGFPAHWVYLAFHLLMKNKQNVFGKLPQSPFVWCRLSFCVWSITFGHCYFVLFSSGLNSTVRAAAGKPRWILSILIVIKIVQIKRSCSFFKFIIQVNAKQFDSPWTQNHYKCQCFNINILRTEWSCVTSFVANRWLFESMIRTGEITLLANQG